MSLEDLLREVTSLLGCAGQVDKQAEARLAQLSNVEGFRLCLLKAATAQELLPDTRLLGAILLKNGIHQYWSPAVAASAMKQEEKNMIKAGLLQAVMATPDKAVSAQLIPCVAKIARHEWPEQWTELCPGLLQLVQASFDSGNLQGTQRSLDLMEQVLQELCSKRLPAHRRQFQLESLKLLAPLTHIWKTQAETFIGLFRQLDERQKMTGGKGEKLSGANVAELVLRGELAILLTHCLQWVVVNGIDNPGDNQDVHQFFSVLLQYIQVLSDFRTGVMTLSCLTGEARLTLHDSMSLLCTTLADVVLKTQTQHAVSFAPFLKVFVSAFLTIFSESFDPEFPSAFKFEKLSIQALNFLSQVVSCDKYGLDPNTDEEDVDEATQRAKDTVRSMITAEVAAKIAQLLVSGFLPLSQAKLTAWEGEPEVFIHEEDVEDVDEGSTAAASSLLWGLVKAYPTTICPLLVRMLGEALRGCPPGSSLADEGEGDVSRPELFKEAVYHALSIATVMLLEQASEGLEFNVVTMAKEILTKEISMVENEEEALGSRIIQRRAILLLGDWIEQIPPPHRPSVYQFTLRLLHHSDLLVSMAALSTLHNILEDAAFEDDEEEGGNEGDAEDDEKLPGDGFKAVDFVGRFCQPICENIFRMMAQSDDFNTHEVLLDRLRQVISTAGSAALASCVPLLTQQLGLLWQDSGEEILRAPVLRTLSCIVSTLGNRSEQLQAMLLPLLMDCLGYHTNRIAQQANESILNDTIRFWRELICSARVPTEPLFNLFDRFGPLVERLCTNFSKDVELGSVKAAEDIYLLLSGVLVGYLLLGGQSFLERQGAVISRVLNGALALQRQYDEEDFGVTTALDFLLQMFPVAASTLLQSTLRDCLEHTFFLAQKPGETATGYTPSHVLAEAATLSKEDAEIAALIGDTPLIVKYLVVLARLLVANTAALLSLLSHHPPAQQRLYLELLMKCFIDYTVQMDPVQTKMSCLASCCLFGILLQGVNDLQAVPFWVPGVLKLISDCQPIHAPKLLTELVLHHPEKAETEVQRRSSLEHQDPVRTIQLAPYFAEKVRDCAQPMQMQVLACAQSTPDYEELARLLEAQMAQRPATFHL